MLMLTVVSVFVLVLGSTSAETVRAHGSSHSRNQQSVNVSTPPESQPYRITVRAGDGAEPAEVDRRIRQRNRARNQSVFEQVTRHRSEVGNLRSRSVRFAH